MRRARDPSRGARRRNGCRSLAGWFIASAAVAGLAVASTFSFLFPSAGVQALAWARTLGRYGERITTHEATLDLVASLRTSLFARALRLPPDRAAELRTSELLGRITGDSDAVENLMLRSTFPIFAAIAALIGTTVFFATLSPTLASVAAAGLILTAGVLIGLAQTAARLLTGVRAYDPHLGLVIALHNRQSLQLPLTPDASIELSRRGAGLTSGWGS